MKKSLLALCTFLSLMSSPAFSHEVGNGGDGVKVGDDLVLRDFISKNPFKVIKNNREFLERYPEFVALIKDMSKAQPFFAMAIWNDLIDANIFFTQAELPLLPAAATALVAGKADAQIAIRSGNDIIISVPNFEMTQDREYVFLHEALHGLMKDQYSPWHHEKVRSLVRELRDNRGKYERQDMYTTLTKFGVSYFNSNWDGKAMMKGSELTDDGNYIKTMSALIQEDASAQYLCAQYNAYNPQWVEFIAKWGPYSKCPADQKIQKVFDLLYPKSVFNVDHLPDLPTFETNFGSGESLAEMNRASCEKYIQPSFIRRVNAAKKEITQALVVTKKALEDSKKEENWLMKDLIRSMAISRTSNLQTYLKLAEDSARQYQKTVNWCEKQGF